MGFREHDADFFLDQQIVDKLESLADIATDSDLIG